MKQGWEIKKLGEVCEILDNYRKPITKHNRSAGIFPYFGATGVLDFVDSFIFDEKLVLLGEDGAKWGAGANSAFAVSGKIWVNNHAHVLRPKRNIILDSWLIYYLNGSNLMPYISGVTVPKLNQGKMRSIPLPIPNLSEQERIVGILDSAFAKIEALRANSQQNLQNTKELFLASIEQEFTIKDGWINIKLYSIADVISGYAFKSGEFIDKGKFQVIRIGNVKQDFLRLAESQIFIDNIDKSTLNKSLLQQGDLVITQTGTKKKRDYGFVALINCDNLLLNQRVACVRFKSKEINPKYFLYYSYTEKYKNDFFAQEGGAVGQGNVGLTTIKELNVPFPELNNEQKCIIEKLDALGHRCRAMEENYRQTIAHCNALKQALLTKAFNEEL